MTPHPRAAAGAVPGWRRAFLLPAALLLGALLALPACATYPTPYQPLDGEGGYGETRLGERVWRISFRANRYTPETDVLDYLYLRAAELTQQSGYTHFVIEQDFGRTQMNIRGTGPRVGMGLGYGSAYPGPFWGTGFGMAGPPEYEGYVAYHLGVFVIRMLTAGEAEGREQTYEAGFLIDSLRPKAERSLRQREE